MFLENVVYELKWVGMGKFEMKEINVKWVDVYEEDGLRGR